MQRAYDPMLLFPLVGLLAAGLTLVLWRRNRGFAISAAVLSAISALLVLNERASIAAHANIRVDLLVTIPVVSLAALVIGLMGLMVLRRPPLAARILGAGLAVVGSAVFAAFSVQMVQSGSEIARLTQISNDGGRLYGEETIRCRQNLARRFGPLDRAGEPCRGNLVVASRSAGSYPFTRAILNDAGEFYLMFSPHVTAEQTWGIDSLDTDRPAARLTKIAGSLLLSGDGEKDGRHIHVDLRSVAAGACEANLTVAN